MQISDNDYFKLKIFFTTFLIFEKPDLCFLVLIVFVLFVLLHMFILCIVLVLFHII